MNVLEDRSLLDDVKQRWKEMVTSTAYVKDFEPITSYLKECVLAWFYEKTKQGPEDLEVRLYMNERVEDHLTVFCKANGQSKYQNQIQISSGELKKFKSSSGDWTEPLIAEFQDFYNSLIKDVTKSETQD
jgi:hypothetical protein